MSYDMVLCVVEFLLGQLSESLNTARDKDNYSRRTRCLMIQTILSGVRVLCLHPNKTVVPRQTVELFERCDHDSLSSDESNALKICLESLSAPLPKEHLLRLPRIETKLYPLDEAHLVRTVEERVQDARSLRSFWALYDISWSVVGAVIAFRADKAREEEAHRDEEEVHGGNENVHEDKEKVYEDEEKALGVAARISGLLPKASGQSPSQEFMLTPFVDPFWPLGPLSSQTDNQSSQSTMYFENISPQDSEELASLKRFSRLLKDRRQTLHNSDDELRQILSEVSRMCSSPEVENTNQQTFSQPRVYILNCPSAHIMTEEEVMGILNGCIPKELKTHGVAHLRDGEQCPVCADPSPVTCVREIKQLSQINYTVTAKMDRQLKSMDHSGERLMHPVNLQAAGSAQSNAHLSISNRDDSPLIKSPEDPQGRRHGHLSFLWKLLCRPGKKQRPSKSSSERTANKPQQPQRPTFRGFFWFS